MVQTWSASGARQQGNLRLACIKRLLIYVEGSFGVLVKKNLRSNIVFQVTRNLESSYTAFNRPKIHLT